MIDDLSKSKSCSCRCQSSNHTLNDLPTTPHIFPSNLGKGHGWASDADSSLWRIILLWNESLLWAISITAVFLSLEESALSLCSAIMEHHSRLEDAKSGRGKVKARSLSHSRNAHLCIVTARCCSRQAQQRFAAQPRTGSEGKCRRAMRTTCPCVYTQTSGIPNACFRTTSRQTKRTNYWDLTAIFMIMFFQAYHPCPCDTWWHLRPCLGLLPSFDGQ